jgi:hypothetical protein
MEGCLCDVPMASEENALIVRPDSIYKFICGRDAEYRVGAWNMCARHKKYLADPNKWSAVKLEEVSDETIDR